jgi:hypothetical protein
MVKQLPAAVSNGSLKSYTVGEELKSHTASADVTKRSTLEVKF